MFRTFPVTLVLMRVVLQSEEHAPLRWYIAVKAADRFHALNGRFPGDTDVTVPSAYAILSVFSRPYRLVSFQIESDTDSLGTLAAELCASLGLEGPPVTCKHVQEMCVLSLRTRGLHSRVCCICQCAVRSL